MATVIGDMRLNADFSCVKISAAEKAAERKKFIRQWRWRNFWQYRWREWPTELVIAAHRLARWVFGEKVPPLLISELRCKLIRWDGEELDLGVVGRHLIVTAGKNYLASCMDNTAEPESLKFHGYGIGTTAAAAGDTLLQSELTTEYATDNTRPTGSQSHLNNTYTTIATVSPDTASSATIAVTEWGLFTVATAATITMLDHQVFSAINLVPAADSLQTTYVLTFS